MLTLLLFFCCSGLAVADEMLGELPQYQGFALSPDGQRLLYNKSNGDTYDVWVRDVASGVTKNVLPHSPKQGLVNWCRWANNERLLCSMRFYRGAGRAGKIIYTRLFAVNHDGTQPQKLVPNPKRQEGRPILFNAQLQDSVLSWLNDDPEHILLQLKRDLPNRPSIYRLNIYTNDLVRVRRPRSKIHRWFADSSGAVRLALGYKGQKTPIMYGVKGQKLEEFASGPYSSEVAPAPLAFAPNGETVYMNMTNGTDRHGVYEVDVNTGAVIKKIFDDPDFDVFGQLILNAKGPTGVRYLRHRSMIHWFDEAPKQYFEELAQRLPGSNVDLVTSDADFETYVVASHGGVVPGYYLVNSRTDEVDLIGTKFNSFAKDEVVDLQPVNFPSRDGLNIPGYLALPKTATGPIPFVLFPHSGPYARDSAEFDYWTQFFISQGYGVLKPNYRGSIGYGQIYMRAGYKQWGLRMQEDLLDGLDWLVERGEADPARTCVVGASYGGYTALVAAYKFADEISCAVSVGGITDLEKLVSRIYGFELVKRNRERIQSDDQLRANSPLHQVERIGVPLLLVHGDTDTVVSVRQARRFAKALKRKSKSFEYIEQEGGDHFLSRQADRTQFFQALAEFLDVHLGTDRP